MRDARSARLLLDEFERGDLVVVAPTLLPVEILRLAGEIDKVSSGTGPRDHQPCAVAAVTWLTWSASRRPKPVFGPKGAGSRAGGIRTVNRRQNVRFAGREGSVPYPKAGPGGRAPDVPTPSYSRPMGGSRRGYLDILRPVKVLLSLDDRLVARIDRAAAELGLSRSAYVAQLAIRELGSRGGPGATTTSRSAAQRLERLFAANPADAEGTAAIRTERDRRARPP